MRLNVYLSGEIHSDWREQIIKGVEENDLPFDVYKPETNHEASDDCGDNILGEEDDPFWKDHKSAKINAIRIRNYIELADIVVVKFGEKYRQWNAAFDAGYAFALGKKLIVIHPDEHRHALKEVDAAALAVCKDHSEVIEILKYISRD